MSVSATSLVYKEALSLIEEAMPATRIKFYSGFLDRRGGARPGDDACRSVLEPPAGGSGVDDDRPAGTCGACGAPSYTDTCGYCRLKEKVRKAMERR